MLIKNDYDGCYEGEEPTLVTKEVTLRELLESNDYEIQAEIKQLGWVNKNKIDEREERLRVLKRYFQSDYGIYFNHYPTIQEVDLDEPYYLNRLAEGNILLQEIALESLPAEIYKQVMKLRKEYEKSKKEKETKKTQNAERRKQKEVEKTKKLLEENGLKITNKKG